MAESWVVVTFPTATLVAAVTRPFRSEAAAQAVADSFNRTADDADHGFNATAQVCRIESVTEVRQHIKNGDFQ